MDSSDELEAFKDLSPEGDEDEQCDFKDYQADEAEEQEKTPTRRHKLQRQRAVHSLDLQDKRFYNSVDIMKSANQAINGRAESANITVEVGAAEISPRSPRRKSLIHNMRE